MKCCRNCEYWMGKYDKCEHPDQRQEDAEDYMAPADNHCSLWEQAEAEE